MIRLIIAGGRTFRDYESLKAKAASILRGLKRRDITIISGTARGADQLGERLAKEFSLKLERYPAQWDKYGKSAGYRRNELMASRATHLLACWDSDSRGTSHMINLAERYGLEVEVLYY